MTTLKDALAPKAGDTQTYCMLNHPYTFRMADGVKLSPDANGVYHPRNASDRSELAYQRSKGFCYLTTDAAISPAKAA